jgi:hypothetical protein
MKKLCLSLVLNLWGFLLGIWFNIRPWPTWMAHLVSLVYCKEIIHSVRVCDCREALSWDTAWSQTMARVSNCNWLFSNCLEKEDRVKKKTCMSSGTVYLEWSNTWGTYERYNYEGWQYSGFMYIKLNARCGDTYL